MVLFLFSKDVVVYLSLKSALGRRWSHPPAQPQSWTAQRVPNKHPVSFHVTEVCRHQPAGSFRLQRNWQATNETSQIALKWKQQNNLVNIIDGVTDITAWCCRRIKSCLGENDKSNESFSIMARSHIHSIILIEKNKAHFILFFSVSSLVCVFFRSAELFWLKRSVPLTKVRN